MFQKILSASSVRLSATVNLSSVLLSIVQLMIVLFRNASQTDIHSRMCLYIAIVLETNLHRQRKS